MPGLLQHCDSLESLCCDYVMCVFLYPPTVHAACVCLGKMNSKQPS